MTAIHEWYTDTNVPNDPGLIRNKKRIKNP